MTSFSLIQPIKLSQLGISLGFCQKRNFLKSQETKVSARDVHMTFSIYAKHFLSINLA